MIEGQFFRSKLVAAILTAVSISRKDVDARKLDGAMTVLQPDEFQQSHDRGQFDRQRNPVDFAIIHFQHFDLPLPEEGDRFLPVHNT